MGTRLGSFPRTSDLKADLNSSCELAITASFTSSTSSKARIFLHYAAHRREIYKRPN